MASHTKSSPRSKPNRSAKLARLTIATSMKLEGRREPCEPLAMSAESAAFAQVSQISKLARSAKSAQTS